jgi:hypothetical protein
VGAAHDRACAEVERATNVTNFLVWDFDNCSQGEAESIHAVDAEAAALIYAERHYPDDYPEVQAIAVRDPLGKRFSMFNVRAEPSVEFRATRLTR